MSLKHFLKTVMDSAFQIEEVHSITEGQSVRRFWKGTSRLAEWSLPLTLIEFVRCPYPEQHIHLIYTTEGPAVAA